MDRIKNASIRKLISLYLKEVPAKHAGISNKETISLIRKMREKDTTEDNSIKYRNRILLNYSRLVISIADRYMGKGISKEDDYHDIISIGNMGILDAIKDFDPDRKEKFITYAYHKTRKRIVRYLTEESRVVDLPQHLAENFKRVRAAYDKIQQRNEGRIPTVNEVYEYLVKEKKVKSMRKSWIKSIIRLIQDRDLPPSMINMDVEDPVSIDSTHSMIFERMKDDIKNVLSELPMEFAEILRLRFGIERERTRSIKETAAVLGISENSLINKERKMMTKLKCKKEDLSDRLREIWESTIN